MAETRGDSGFVCRGCGRCCQGKGGILLTARGRDRAAELLALTAREFTARYLTPEAGLFAVGIGPDGFCLLRSEAGCRIHQAKPLICQAWPFFYGPLTDEGSFLEARAACPGLSGWDWARLKGAAPQWPPKNFRQLLLSLARET
ncbi:MAG: YkgJ family cysteine cluster protein [Deltaproteobacteria bacterium]|nr:YkgJ family cysteine cluster protein [Deltaproteobacteria bacterium]